MAGINKMKEIFFAGGCFWGTEHYIRQFEGVAGTSAGYANGNIANPTYGQVYTDNTGFAECVKVTYDPDIIELATLCRLFFKSIDPLLKNRQGDDCGTRYRTGIYWTSDEDRVCIEHVYDEIQASYGLPLVVEKEPLKCFYPAEDYHQDYLVKNPDGYCHLSFETLHMAKTYARIMKKLRALANEEKKTILSRFFKTGKGEYGEGDKFLGVTVPAVRSVAREHKEAGFDIMETLLESEWHECRLCALLMLRDKYKAAPEQVAEFYLSHTAGINNWDLVDLSAPYIIGDYLSSRSDRTILYELAGSSDMWKQRIAVVSTLMLIRKGQYGDTIRLAEMFLDTPHDLMKKAVGWMLREVGKRDEGMLVDFLEKYKREMPRTMLRYAIEKFPPESRRNFMAE